MAAHACMPKQVQSGVARTGKWWGHQQVAQEDVQPDIMIFAKGIASGFPFAGLATREHVFEVRCGLHSISSSEQSFWVISERLCSYACLAPAGAASRVAMVQGTSGTRQAAQGKHWEASRAYTQYPREFLHCRILGLRGCLEGEEPRMAHLVASTEIAY